MVSPVHSACLAYEVNIWLHCQKAPDVAKYEARGDGRQTRNKNRSIINQEGKQSNQEVKKIRKER